MKPFQKLTLPQHFAQSILDNQIEFKLAEKPPAEVICNLIELYSTGVEYYESIKSYKYLYFKKKMTQLFTDNSKAFVQTSNKAEECEIESPMRQKLHSKNDEQRIQALKIKEKQEKLQMEVTQRTRTNQTKKEVEKIIKNVAQKEKKMQKTIKSTLEDQDKALEEKMKQRKKRSFCKSFSAYGLTECTQTKSSLFQEISPAHAQTDNKLNDKVIVEPLIVNFQSVINDNDSEDQKEIIIMKAKKSIIPKGRMASMGRLIE